MKKSTRNLLILGGIVLGVILIAKPGQSQVIDPGTGGGFPDDPVPQLPDASAEKARSGRFDEKGRSGSNLAGARYSPYRTRASWAV